MDMLCSDKTGTLTKNELTLGEPQPAPGRRRATLCCSAAVLSSRRDAPDAIDAAILAGAPASLGRYRAYVVKAFHPFDPVAKRAEADIEHDGRTFKVAKGAPQVIIDLCEPGTPTNAARLPRNRRRGRGKGIPHARRRADRRCRQMAISRFACRCLIRRGTIAAATIATTRAMGVDIKMVTGDHEAIAKEIAGQLKLGQNIVVAEARIQTGWCRT